MAVYYPDVREPRDKAVVAVHTAVLPGDPVGWDPYNLRMDKADPDSTSGPIPAQFIAVEKGNADAPVLLCRSCTIYNIDAPWTAGAQLFASGALGALSHSADSAAGNKVLAIGFASTSSLAHVDCRANLPVPILEVL